MLLNNLFKRFTYQLFAPGVLLREKYESFKKLLNYNLIAHNLMADIEDIYYNNKRVDLASIRKMYNSLYVALDDMVYSLINISPAYVGLRDYLKKIDFYIKMELTDDDYFFSLPFVLKIDDLPENPHKIAGGKAENLCIIKRNLDIPVPASFVITTNAYYYFLEFNNLKNKIDAKLEQVDINDPLSLNQKSREISLMIKEAEIPPALYEDIIKMYNEIWGDKKTRLAMRSSAISEDTEFSFAGQYSTKLNVVKEDIAENYKEVIASKYCPNAIFYRINYGLIDIQTPMAVIVQELINSKISGVIFTEAEEKVADEKAILIQSIWGLGELLVSGEVTPDTIYLKKNENLEIIKENCSSKYELMTTSGIKDLSDEIKDKMSLSQTNAKILGKWAIMLEDLYGHPQDIEWAIDGKGNKFLLQSRPLKKDILDNIKKPETDIYPDKIIISGHGETASKGIAAGNVFLLKETLQFSEIPQDCILITKTARPEYVSILKRIKGLITEQGGTTGHLASVAREYGLPMLTGLKNALNLFEDGSTITLWADEKKIFTGIINEFFLNYDNKPSKDDEIYLNSPLHSKLKKIIKKICQLKLTDPFSPDFQLENCKSFHDMIRFIHEKSVNEMFSIGLAGQISKGAKRLQTNLPFIIYVLDMGGGIKKEFSQQKEISLEHLSAEPLKKLMEGLSHKDIKWADTMLFNWKNFTEMVDGGGISSADSPDLSSYAIISEDYLNINVRFGYHFVIIDSICGDNPQQNYITFRFAGGGGLVDGRLLRANFLCKVLKSMQFETKIKGDTVEATIKNDDKISFNKKIYEIGRLLGVTKQMDLKLNQNSDINYLADQFVKGKSDL
jgi:pyruvate,water dikinase